MSFLKLGYKDYDFYLVVLFLNLSVASQLLLCVEYNTTLLLSTGALDLKRDYYSEVHLIPCITKSF